MPLTLRPVPDDNPGSELASYETVYAYLTHRQGGDVEEGPARAILAHHSNLLLQGITKRAYAYYVGTQILEAARQARR